MTMLDGHSPAATPTTIHPGWARLQQELELAFSGKPDLQARVPGVIEWLAQNSLDASRKRAA